MAEAKGDIFFSRTLYQTYFSRCIVYYTTETLITSLLTLLTLKHFYDCRFQHRLPASIPALTVSKSAPPVASLTYSLEQRICVWNLASPGARSSPPFLRGQRRPLPWRGSAGKGPPCPWHDPMGRSSRPRATSIWTAEENCAREGGTGPVRQRRSPTLLGFPKGRV